MKMYLAHDAKLLCGSDGYSYGLLHGEHADVLISFVVFSEQGDTQIIDHTAVKYRRRKLVRRVTKPTAKRKRRTHNQPPGE